MVTEKKACKYKNYLYKEMYYRQARQGMHDIVEKMHLTGLIDYVYLPGYIGWSPKEGSGIFDSIISIEGIDIIYYKMTDELEVDENDLYRKIADEKSLVLLVNYFGFRDRHINRIINNLKKRNVYIMEDNAHGFFTWHENPRIESDLIIFSLHKMFPFKNGGSLVIQNEKLAALKLKGKIYPDENTNPYAYHLHEIAMARKKNYLQLSKELIIAEKEGYLYSLKKDGDLEKNVPQTYPVILKMGNRDKVYELMNKAGYGVVSLYHTLIKPLQNEEYEDSLNISKHILNLPVHQDVDITKYSQMVDYLMKCCKDTVEESHDKNN